MSRHVRAPPLPRREGMATGAQPRHRLLPLHLQLLGAQTPRRRANVTGEKQSFPGFDLMADIIDMGGFGGYVWASYTIAVLCLGWLTYASWKSEKIAAKLLADLQKNQPEKNS